jgi:hypothetical protein
MTWTNNEIETDAAVEAVEETPNLEFFEYFKDKDIKTVLKIGAFQGKNTEMVMEHINPETLYVVEDWKTIPREVLYEADMPYIEQQFEFKTAKYKSVKILKDGLDKVLDKVVENNSVDLVIIKETDKDALKSIIKKVKSKVKKPGYITGIGWGSKNVVFACLETIGDVDEYYSDVNSKWIKVIK